MRERGFVIYPGKLAGVATFRIGCIGALPDDRSQTRSQPCATRSRTGPWPSNPA